MNTLKIKIILAISLMLITKVSFSQLSWDVIRYSWASQGYIDIYFEIVNEGNETGIITENSEIFLFDENNYQFRFVDDFFPVKVFPGKKINLELTFSVKYSAKNLRLGFGSTNSSIFISNGYEFDKEAEKKEKEIADEEDIYLIMDRVNALYAEKSYEQIYDVLMGAIRTNRDYTLLNYRDTITSILTSIARYYCAENNVKRALDFYDYASSFSVEKEDIIYDCVIKIAKESLEKGDMSLRNKKIIDALENYTLSLSVFKHLHDEKQLIEIKPKFAKVYELLGDDSIKKDKLGDALDYYYLSQENKNTFRIRKKINETKDEIHHRTFY